MKKLVILALVLSLGLVGCGNTEVAGTVDTPVVGETVTGVVEEVVESVAEEMTTVEETTEVVEETTTEVVEETTTEVVEEETTVVEETTEEVVEEPVVEEVVEEPAPEVASAPASTAFPYADCQVVSGAEALSALQTYANDSFAITICNDSAGYWVFNYGALLTMGWYEGSDYITSIGPFNNTLCGSTNMNFAPATDANHPSCINTGASYTVQLIYTPGSEVIGAAFWLN